MERPTEENDFEGTLVLEKLTSHLLVDDFFEAIDSESIGRAIKLMKKAQVNSETIEIVLKIINDEA
ncbi:MAG: hypothetical protein H7235_09815 [Bdellovibrionaceae bacterium]|nr:hypothetical protein [Pseudobdellovibrionaceae bacterium]